MKDIAIYGAGGLGREITCLIRQINYETDKKWNFIGFFDDGKEKGLEISGFGNILGGIEELNSWPSELNVVLCFGSTKTLQIISSRINNQDIVFPNIIAPDFKISDNDTFEIGKGNIISNHCAVTTNISIGNFNLLNGSVAFGHDVCVGDYNVFMPGTRISGSVSIGNNCMFGSGCFVKQELVIPDGVTLGPLSPLLTQPKAESLYIGNPARRIKF